MVTASGSGNRVRAVKLPAIDKVPTSPRHTWLATLLLLRPSRSCPVEARNSTTGKMPKKERKKTSSPAGMSGLALSRLDITRNTSTEVTLNAMPTIAPRPCADAAMTASPFGDGIDGGRCHGGRIVRLRRAPFPPQPQHRNSPPARHSRSVIRGLDPRIQPNFPRSLQVHLGGRVFVRP